MAMFNLFGEKGKLGIDIGTASIKVVELQKKGQRFELSNYGLFELKSGVSDSQATAGRGILKLPDEEIIWGIKEVIKKSGIKSTDVVASIPSFSTFSTIIEMPYLSEQDLAKALPFEAKKYIPIPLNEVVLDWSIIDISNVNPVPGKSGLGSKPTTVEVFVAAVPKEETVRYQRIMKGAGLNLRALELENTALIRALLGNDLSSTAIVNIGGRSTSIVIVNKGYERVSHNYEVGGFEITKSIARSLNVGLEKAEELKRKIGLKPSDENIVNEAMTSLVDMMVFETKKTLSNYESSKNIKISKILLIGGLSNMPHFMEYFKKKLNMDVYGANAFARIIYPQQLSPVIQELANAFAIATGLAMREI
ncbi:MAG: type IV pilus assembly protein PilM [Candidatus Yanofskybacteria bacterium]|nr:type IV pilus assembly protein PilM [Candidatus Yanofskybacteria bacterium]